MLRVTGSIVHPHGTPAVADFPRGGLSFSVLGLTGLHGSPRTDGGLGWPGGFASGTPFCGGFKSDECPGAKFHFARADALPLQLVEERLADVVGLAKLGNRQSQARRR